MWISNVVLLTLLCLVTSLVSENNSGNSERQDGFLECDISTLPSTDHETCPSGKGSCSASTSDVASTVIRELYKTFRKVDQDLANPNNYPKHYSPSEGEEFDFIIVGSGSAGAVVANRLSEVSSWRVLLVEAGGNPTKSSEIPGLAPTLLKTDLDWQYMSGPEKNVCLGMVNNSCYWPRGKALGGTSTINFNMYARGNAKDFDNWAAAGNTGWGYEDVLPYFKKSEDMRISEILLMNDWEKYHRKGGYLKIESWTYSKADSLLDIFGKGFEELGYSFNVDYNGKTQTGFTRFHATLENHKRCSSAKAFLSSAKERKNLKVAKHSFVTKLLIDKSSSSVFGVEFINEEGKTVHVHSKNEVVLSAGAINTPQILILSGIGPKDQLKDLPVVKDLPIGENLQDHPVFSLVVTVNQSVPLPDMKESMLEFISRNSGEMTNMGATDYTAFVNTKKSDIEDFPDLQIIPIHFSKDSAKSITVWLKQVVNLRDEIIKPFLEINKKGDCIFLLGFLLRPYSRGKISFKDIDPKARPKILSGLLSDTRDVETFLRSYNIVEQLVKTKALKSIDAKLHEVRLPGCEKHPFRSREYRECSIRHLTNTGHHYCGTCKMGPSSDPEAVVDPSLRVFGVKGLRVADASVMPTIISGNINAAVVMIGEKAADLIKKDWVQRDEL